MATARCQNIFKALKGIDKALEVLILFDEGLGMSMSKLWEKFLLKISQTFMLIFHRGK